MGKLVVLKLYGELEQQGFRVNLEIGAENSRPQIELTGYLPPSTQLATHLQQHWETYRGLGAPARIKPKRINYDNQVKQRVSECQASASQLHSQLTSWLQAEQFRPLDQRLREELNRDEPIRVLIGAEDQRLHKLPWHLWDLFDHYPQAELGLCTTRSARRQKLTPAIRPQKFRILAILGHSDNIDIEADRQLLDNLPNAEIRFLVEPQRKEITDQLWEQPWDIIFFAGHSETEADIGRIYLNQHESLTIDELWYALRKAVDNGLQLAIFNSCDGLGLAHRLDDLHIPQMMVMRELVPDEVAHEFLKYFLLSFSQGESLYLAVREARERLQGLESSFPCASWLPVIYQHPAEVPLSWKQKQPHKQWLPRLDKKLSLVASFLVFGFLGWQWGAPKLAMMANNYGMDNYLAGNFVTASSALNWVTRIDPQDGTAYYTLGHMCEQAADFDCAEQKYRQAAKLGFGAAYSQLARIQIKQKQDYTSAVSFAWRGLNLTEDLAVKYSLWKNLGWARLEQGRYQEAEEALGKALNIDPQQAVPYCLLAQVKEKQKSYSNALDAWKACLQYAQPDIEDEDIWIGIARQKLK